MNLEECFSILEIEPTESKSKIKAAYRDLLFVWHPDRFPNDPRLQAKADEKLKEINQAYELVIQYLEFREQENQTRAGSQTPQQNRHETTTPPSQDQSPPRPPPPTVDQAGEQVRPPTGPRQSIWTTPITPGIAALLSVVGFVVITLFLASLVDKPSKPSRAAPTPVSPVGGILSLLMTPMIPSPTPAPTPTPTWYPKTYRYVPPPTATPVPVFFYTLETPLPTPVSIYAAPVDPSTYVLVWKVPTVEVSSEWPTWAKGFTYSEALAVCEYLDLVGLDDWRLPTTKELTESAPESIGLSWAWSPKQGGYLGRRGELVTYDKSKAAPVVCVRVQVLSELQTPAED